MAAWASPNASSTTSPPIRGPSPNRYRRDRHEEVHVVGPLGGDEEPELHVADQFGGLGEGDRELGAMGPRPLTGRAAALEARKASKDGCSRVSVSRSSTLVLPAPQRAHREGQNQLAARCGGASSVTRHWDEVR
jgi:hypothetical protein